MEIPEEGDILYDIIEENTWPLLHLVESGAAPVSKRIEASY